MLYFIRTTNNPTDWTWNFNHDFMKGLDEKGVEYRVLPPTDGEEREVVEHRLNCVSNFLKTDLTDEDVILLGDALKCNFEQILWVKEIVKHSKAKLCSWIHGGTFIKGDSINVYTPWVRQLEKILFTHSNLIFCSTHFFKKMLVEAGCEEYKVKAVGFPISKDNFKSDTDTDENLIIWNHPLTLDQRPQLFFKLMDYVISRRPETRFRVLTSNPDWDKVNHPSDKKMVTTVHSYELKYLNNFRVQHIESKDKYYHWLNKGFIAPTFGVGEAFGNAVAEALASETLTILPKYTSYPEMVEHDPNLLYTSVEEVYERILYYLNKPKEGRKVAKNASQYLGKYSPQIVVGRLIEALEL